MAKLLGAICAVISGLMLLQTMPALAEETTLVLVIRTGPELSQQFVKEAVEETLKKISPTRTIGDVIRGDVRIRNLTPQEYTAYRRVTEADAPEVPLPQVNGEKFEMRRLPDFEPAWLIKLTGNEAKVLDDVTLESADETKRVVKIEKDKNDLVMIRPGTYVLRLPPGEQPKNAKLNIRDLNDKSITEEVDWPRGDNFYQIRLSDFRGNQQRFVGTIKDKEAVGGYAMDSFDINKNISIAVGEAKASSDDVLEDDYFTQEGGVEVVVPPLPNVNQDNVRPWILFPLSKQEADKLQKQSKSDTPKGAWDKIRNGPYPYYPIGKPLPQYKPGDSPRWIEMPPIGPRQANGSGGGKPRPYGGNGRPIPIGNGGDQPLNREDYQKLLDQLKDKQVGVSYVFNDENGPKNVIPHKNGCDDESCPITARPLKWTQQLQRLATGGPKDSIPGKKDFERPKTPGYQPQVTPEVRKQLPTLPEQKAASRDNE